MGMLSGELQQSLPLDVEWVKLMQNAKDMGFSVDDIRLFLKQCIGQGTGGDVERTGEEI